eukprot:NODE_10133_length_1375_cov_2.311699.p3 GENE.NODE_10133_length_1375_cov_2.311699~~NODE_10133_length_1375_cov_2.311699.p3  ORF type:complete len:120 (-),score=14.23 NODE_10133_length_1375_cov_2.311699:349-708(-)
MQPGGGQTASNATWIDFFTKPRTHWLGGMPHTASAPPLSRRIGDTEKPRQVADVLQRSAFHAHQSRPCGGARPLSMRRGRSGPTPLRRTNAAWVAPTAEHVACTFARAIATWRCRATLE